MNYGPTGPKGVPVGLLCLLLVLRFGVILSSCEETQSVVAAAQELGEDGSIGGETWFEFVIMAQRLNEYVPITLVF